MTRALPQNLVQGIVLIIIAAFVISVSDVVFKGFAGHLSLWQVFTVRGVMTLPMVAGIGWLIWRTSWADIRAGFAPWPLLRAVTFAGTLLAFYASLPFLALSVVGAANYTAPLFVAILAVFVVGERVSPFGWLGIAVGFTGLLMLMQPWEETFSAWVFLPLGGAVSYAISHTITRVKCQHLSPASLSFAQNFCIMAGGLILGGLFLTLPDPSNNPQLFGAWPALGASDYGLLLALAAITVTGSTLIARAYQIAPPAIIATFEYAYLPFALFWDVMRGETPNNLALSGVALIIVAGVLVTRR